MIFTTDRQAFKVFINPIKSNFDLACSRAPRPSVVSSDYSDEEEISTTEVQLKPAPDKR